MRGHLVALGILAAALGVSPATGAEEPVGGVPPLPAVSSGDILFHLDAAAFRGAEGKNRVEVYLAVPNDQIRFTEKDGGFHGRLGLRLQFLDAEGSPGAGFEREYALSAGTLRAAEDRTILQIVTESVEVPAGTYRLRAEVQDLETIKTGIWYQLRGEHPRGTAEGGVVSPPVADRPVALSDIEFARSLGRARADSLSQTPREGPFTKGGLEVVPNPGRLYGLLLPELVGYVEVYARPEAHGQSVGKWSTTYRITGAGGTEVFRQQRVGIQETLTTWAKTVRIDISQLPAGSYVLHVQIADETGRTLAEQSAAFEVAWSLYSWGKQLTEILTEMQMLLTPQQYEQLQRMSRGEAETFLADFWRDRDPTPETPVNEALQEHFRRIAYANRHYTVGGHEGMLTDRGRIYVRYGTPDDTEEGYGDDFLQVPEEESRSMFTPPGPGSSTNDPFTDRLLDSKSREGLERALESGGASGGKRYEIWYYDTREGTLVDRERGVRRPPRMRFVFLDQSGYGDFKIVYSSEPSEY